MTGAGDLMISGPSNRSGQCVGTFVCFERDHFDHMVVFANGRLITPARPKRLNKASYTICRRQNLSERIKRRIARVVHL